MMPEDYLALADSLKEIGIPFAENGWNTRPDAESWGVVTLEYETDALHGDDLKQAEAYEGSVDLYTKIKGGGEWYGKIREALKEHCEGCWRLNHHGYEHETGLFHYEWTFQVEG